MDGIQGIWTQYLQNMVLLLAALPVINAAGASAVGGAGATVAVNTAAVVLARAIALTSTRSSIIRAMLVLRIGQIS